MKYFGPSKVLQLSRFVSAETLIRMMCLNNIGQYARQNNIDSGKFKLQKHNFKLASIRKPQDIWRRNIQDYAIGYKDNGQYHNNSSELQKDRVKKYRMTLFGSYCQLLAPLGALISLSIQGSSPKMTQNLEK